MADKFVEIQQLFEKGNTDKALEIQKSLSCDRSTNQSRYLTLG